MDIKLLIICGLTFVIHVIATLANAVRIACVRTRRIAVSFSLFRDHCPAFKNGQFLSGTIHRKGGASLISLATLAKVCSVISGFSC